MANPEHLAKLKEGVEAWNKWREENPDVIPKLRKAKLAGINLNTINLFRAKLLDADLSQTELLEANLEEAHLRDANLYEAHLSGSNLKGANLRKTNMKGAMLQEADLEKADLFGAILERANLKGADLQGANLQETILERTILQGANLQGASLIGASLKAADLQGADLRGTVFAADANTSDENANLERAILTSAKFTPEGEPIDYCSFLDLAACKGLESAFFDDETFLQEYIIKAFEYAHRDDIPERKEWPDFWEVAIDRIKFLRGLYSGIEPPPEVIQVVKLITDELIAYLKKRPKEMYNIRPRQFEELIAEILASYGWEVQLTPATRDGGYDILAVSKDISGIKNTLIVECKKYAVERKVGIDIVRNLYGTMAVMTQGANALLATTSYFSKDAEAFKASRYDLELKDYHGVLEWINEYKPNPNGKLYIKDNKLIVPGEE